MAITWRSLGVRAHVSRRLAGEIALAVVLGMMLAVAWSDGTPNNDPYAGGMPAYARIPSLVATLPGVGNLPAASTTTAALANSLVPTAPPEEILVPALDVHRPVEKVGVDQSGVLSLPVNSWDAGWFEYGPVPGAPGDAVIEGHSGYPGKPLIFGRLNTLRPGDRIIVVLSDRSRQLFIVVSKATVPAGSYPQGLADPYGPARLTLITCAGYFDKYTYSSSQRLLVEARYAGVI